MERPQPLPYERHDAHWLDPAHSRDVYVVPFGEGARHLLLNRPAALNALNLSMVRRMHELVQALDMDKDVSICLMSGRGGKAFCAGGDVRVLHDAGLRRKQLRGETGDTDVTKSFFLQEYALNFRLHHTRFPLVAVMNGITMGGGVGLSGHLRYRVATPHTLLAMPECSIGFFPDVGSSFLLPRLHHPFLGHYLGLTGARLRGYDLLHAGLATHWVEHDDWAQQVETAFTRTGLTWQQAEDTVENVFWHLCQPDPEPPFSLSPLQLEIIAEAFSKETMEEVVERLEARRDSSSSSAGGVSSSASSQQTAVSAFVSSTLSLLSAGSPLSQKVTLELLRRGQHQPLERCLETEYRVSQRFMLGEDFYSGVNSALISKDRKPRWQHSGLSQVTDSDVAAYFEPLRGQDELKLAYPKWKEPQWFI